MSARKLLPLLLALVLGAAAAAGLVACGKSDHLIPSSDASTLDKQLSALKDSVDQGKCDSVGDDLQRLDTAVANLPKSVDAELRKRLRNGVTNLSARAPGACQAVDTVVITTPEVTTQTDPEIPTNTEPAPDPDPEPTTTTEPPPPDPTPTTPEPEPDPTPTPPDDGTSGGAVAP